MNHTKTGPNSTVIFSSILSGLIKIGHKIIKRKKTIVESIKTFTKRGKKIELASQIISYYPNQTGLVVNLIRRHKHN